MRGGECRAKGPKFAVGAGAGGPANGLKLHAMKGLTRQKVDGLRGELFHMILFSMAWVLIGEQVFNFRDYAAGAGVILVLVVWMALYSNKLYEIEDRLPPAEATAEAAAERKGMRRDQLFAWILLLEGIAILVTWILLLNWGYSSWMISLCALVAGLHFFPLAWSIHQESYYILGIWTCLLAAAGYWMIRSGRMIDHEANLLVAYGCALGSAIDGLGVIVRTRNLIRR
jgi:hypothetical protein